jgi:hypothetical protein
LSTPIIMQGLLQDRPAGAVVGRLYFATDTLDIYADDGNGWNDVTLQPPIVDTVELVVDGYGAVPETGSLGYQHVPSDGQILSWTLRGNSSGSAQITIKRCRAADFPNTTSIVASAPPSLVNQTTRTNSALVGWSKAVNANDLLEINLDSISGITRLTLNLQIMRTQLPLLKDTIAARPAAGIAGRLYFATDTLVVYRDTGSAWVEATITPSGGGGGGVPSVNGITQAITLTGDGVTTSGDTITIASIAPAVLGRTVLVPPSPDSVPTPSSGSGGGLLAGTYDAILAVSDGLGNWSEPLAYSFVADADSWIEVDYPADGNLQLYVEVWIDDHRGGGYRHAVGAAYGATRLTDTTFAWYLDSNTVYDDLAQPTYGTWVTPRELFLNISDMSNFNTALGRLALFENAGSSNTAIGDHALTRPTTGGGNTAVGSGAAQSLTSGNQNVALGATTLPSVTSGGSNTVLGSGAGVHIATGNGNIAVGYGVGPTGDFNATIAIGGNPSKDGEAVLGNGTTTSETKLFGDLSFNVSAAGGDPAVLKVMMPSLPVADPHIVGQVWNDGGVLTVSAG